MPKVINITNQKFGKLIAKMCLPERHHAGGKIWLCQCDCGGTKEVELSLLKKGHVKSCGCLRKDKRTKKQIEKLQINSSNPTLQNTWKQLYARYKSNTKARNIDFKLSFEQAYKMFTNNCFYCGCRPSRLFLYSNRKHKLDILYNGIDRVDNSVGYTVKNTVACCTRCNTAKSNMGLKEFKQWISAIYERVC